MVLCCCSTEVQAQIVRLTTITRPDPAKCRGHRVAVSSTGFLPSPLQKSPDGLHFEGAPAQLPGARLFQRRLFPLPICVAAVLGLSPVKKGAAGTRSRGGSGATVTWWN